MSRFLLQPEIGLHAGHQLVNPMVGIKFLLLLLHVVHVLRGVLHAYLQHLLLVAALRHGKLHAVELHVRQERHDGALHLAAEPGLHFRDGARQYLLRRHL